MHPPDLPAPRGYASAAHTAAALTRELAQLGITRTYTAAAASLAVISVTAELTVWTNGRQLWCTHGGQRHTWPDTSTAANSLTALARH